MQEAYKGKEFFVWYTRASTGQEVGLGVGPGVVVGLKSWTARKRRKTGEHCVRAYKDMKIIHGRPPFAAALQRHCGHTPNTEMCTVADTGCTGRRTLASDGLQRCSRSVPRASTLSDGRQTSRKPTKGRETTVCPATDTTRYPRHTEVRATRKGVGLGVAVVTVESVNTKDDRPLLTPQDLQLREDTAWSKTPNTATGSSQTLPPRVSLFLFSFYRYEAHLSYSRRRRLPLGTCREDGGTCPEGRAETGSRELHPYLSSFPHTRNFPRSVTLPCMTTPGPTGVGVPTPGLR